MYNWGTVTPAEVNRLLFEYIGWEQANADPGQTVLKPHANADREILLPTRYVKDSTLPVDQTHTIKIKKPVDPPVAIRIERLSRWFIPGKEKCDLIYSLEGLAKNASKVQFAVYGSNYTAAGDWNDGFVKFAAAPTLADTRLYTNMEKDSAPERGQNFGITEWKGTVNATSGALGKKNPANKDRVINAAFSPYTAHLRYYVDVNDRDGRLETDAFWPLFDATTGFATADSLKIRFAVRGTDRISATAGGGTLQVYDGNGDLVYREPISLANLAKKDAGFNEIAWNGDYSPHTKTNSAGTAKVIAADMPYRVQVQVHTGPGQDNGLALAAMSTEVRIYVHPQTHSLTLNPYVAATDQTSLLLQCKREVLSVKDDIKRADGELWVREQLARAGFHPGPVENSVNTAFTSALNEFKRSVPKRKAKPADPFTRLPMTAPANDPDLLNAVEDLAAATTRHRKWFGKPVAGRPNLDFDSDELQTRLRDPNDELIVWVDDRHYYTDPSVVQWNQPKGVQTWNKVKGLDVAMGNYAMDLLDGDPVIDGKAGWIPRPWIPLTASPILLGKAQGLTDVVAAPNSEADLKFMAEAVGPLRVDWSFDEIDADPPVEAIVQTAMYDAGVTRSKLAAEHYRNAAKSTAPYARKDVTKNCVYSNTPAANGGVRPAADADYYKAMFAQDAESLKPWKAQAVSATETIATIAHDNTGQDDDKLAVKRLGAAGIYFRPSTIAGDGMRLRAQMRFAAAGDYQFPNLGVLEKRYPRLPQVQTAKLRIWRKASMRAFVHWGAKNSWAVTSPTMFRFFEASYLHFEGENGITVTAQKAIDIMKDASAYRNLVKESLDTSGAASAEDKVRAKNANIALTEGHLWPWYDAPQFGVTEYSDEADQAAAVEKLKDNFMRYFRVLTNLYGPEFIRLIEGSTGNFRGHVIVEYDPGRAFLVQQYECLDCNSKFWFVETQNKGDSRFKDKCPVGCGGKLGRVAPVYIGHYSCANGHHWELEESTVVGGDYVGVDCPKGPCKGAGIPLAIDTAVCLQYICAKCGWSDMFADATGKDHENEACYAAACDGKLHRAGGTGGLFTQFYTCNKCNTDVNLKETTVGGGSHTGQTHSGCTKLISGKLQPKAGAAVIPLVATSKVDVRKALPNGYDDLTPVAIGNALGVSWNNHAGDQLWAHELAHNRYLQHAGNAPGAQVAQHDTEPNGHPAFAAIGETEAVATNWDRACLMTYAHNLATFDAVRDKTYVCGKCILKVRGWKVEGLANAASALHE